MSATPEPPVGPADGPCPEPAPDATPDRPKPRLRRADREQLLPPMPPDGLRDDDHQARLVWQFPYSPKLRGRLARARVPALQFPRR